MVCRGRLEMSVAELARLWTEAARDQSLVTSATSASGRAKPTTPYFILSPLFVEVGQRRVQ